MAKTRVIFIGSQNLGGLLDDGETMKNHMLSTAIEKHVDIVTRIDVRNRPKRYYYLLKLLLNLLFFRDSKIVMSSSPMVADSLLKVMKMLKWIGNNIYYWVIGGTFGKLIQEGKVEKTKYLDLHKIIVEGVSMKAQLEEAGFQNSMVLPNMKTIDYLPVLKEKNKKPIKFVFLSRVMPQKGVNYIIDAAHSLVESGINDFIVDIYGRIDPSYETELHSKIKEDKNVEYKGFLMLNEKNGYDTLASYDVMLFPTYWHGEGFPGIIIDAFVAGLPVIASNWNLNTSLIKDNSNGVIIPVHDVSALAEAMKNVISGKTNINLMSKNAQKEAMRYDVNNVITNDLLRDLEIIN